MNPIKIQGSGALSARRSPIVGQILSEHRHKRKNNPRCSPEKSDGGGEKENAQRKATLGRRKGLSAIKKVAY